MLQPPASLQSKRTTDPKHHSLGEPRSKTSDDGVVREVL